MAAPRSRDELAARIGEATRSTQTAVDAVDALAAELMGVNRTDARCLDICLQHGQIAAGQLAREAGLTSGGATTALDRLERAGYVRRVRDPVDRRRVLIEPTAEAQRVAAALYGEIARDGAALIGGYTDAQLELIADFVERARELQVRQLQRLSARLADAGATGEAS